MSLYDCDDLLAKMKIRGMIPTAAGSWSDANLLSAISDESEAWLMPLLIKAKGEFLVKTEDIALVASQAEYRANSRVAVVRQVSLIRADGVELPLDEITPSQKTEMLVQPGRVGVPMFYNFKDGTIELWPVPAQAGGSLRVKYHYRLNRLALAADTVTISAITVGGGAGGSTRLTVGGLPATLNAITKVDLIRSVPNFDLLAFDVVPQTALATSGTAVDVLAAVMPTVLAVGDRVAVARYTPFPNMPPELHLCAALRGAAAAVGSKGDRAAQQALIAEASAKETSLLSGILQPRSKGNARILVNRRFR